MFRRFIKWLGIVISAPILLFLLIAILVYIPPIQKLVVSQVTKSLSSSMKMKISIEDVRLAFPLDLAVNGIIAIDGRDTVIDAKSLRLNVEMLPLLKSQAMIDGFGLYDVKLNTKDFISDTKIVGVIGELKAVSKGVEWSKENVRLNFVKLKNADVNVLLSDTAKKDTTPSTNKWKILVDAANVSNSRVYVQMPGDSIRIDANIGTLALSKGLFDTGINYYSAKKVTLEKSDVAYDVPYKSYVKGLDYNHLFVRKLRAVINDFSIDSLGRMRVDVPLLSFNEKSGLSIKNAVAHFSMDAANFNLTSLQLKTPFSFLNVKAQFPFSVFDSIPKGNMVVSVDAKIGRPDVEKLVMPILPKEYRSYVPKSTLYAGVTLDGNMANLKCREIRLALPQVLSLKLSGYAKNILQENRSGNISFGLKTMNASLLNSIMPRQMHGTIHIPSAFSMKGKVNFARHNYNANLQTRLGGGTLNTRAVVDDQSEKYNLVLHSTNFPLGLILPNQHVSSLSANIKANGIGFNPIDIKSRLMAQLNVYSFSYDIYNLSTLKMDAKIVRGKGDVLYSIENDLVQGNGNVKISASKQNYNIGLETSIANVSLNKLGVVSDTMDVGSEISMQLQANKSFTKFNVTGELKNIHAQNGDLGISVSDINLGLLSTLDTTHVYANSGDLNLDLKAHGGVDKIGQHIAAFTSLLQKQMTHKMLDYNALKTKLPTLKLFVNIGNKNPIINLLRLKGYNLQKMYVDLSTNPLDGINGTSKIYTLKTKEWQLDTISLNIIQDTSGICLKGNVLNCDKNNPDKFDLGLDAYIRPSLAGLRLIYFDEEKKKGLDVGIRVELSDSGLRVSISPEKSIIAYRTFTANKDNYLFLGKKMQISGNIDLLADDGTGLKLNGEPNDSVNDITVSANHVNLGELSNVLPYMPKLKGLLNGDLHLRQKGKEITAMSSIQTSNLFYEGMPLGNVGADLAYLPMGDKHQISAYVSSNGKDVLFTNGMYDTKGKGNFNGTVELTQFPFALINGFMSGTNVAFGGYCDGSLTVDGSLAEPKINGDLKLDSASVFSDAYGFNFRMDNRPIEIKNSRLELSKFNLHSTGKEPLVLNGNVDISNFSKVAMNLSMKANNFELINTKRKPNSMIFGKVYADYVGTLKGTVDDIHILGKLSVLDGTDMTYILKDSPLSTDDQMKNLVHFVNFKDSTESVPETVITGGIDITLGISVSDAAHFHCDLSDDKQSYVDLEGGGNLTMRMSQQGDLRMVGRFSINSGEMKYALPVIPLKTFQLQSGSYVNFTGDITDPTLNIVAKERVKTIVTENDVPRSVAFDVGLSLSQPLSKMGLEFIIEAPEDLSIQNQLAAMTREQRGKVAVSMLATGMYLTDIGSNTTGLKANNALNAFLQSEIQNIAGNALKTIDLNVGIESGTSNVGTATTDYSFQFAKRFWGNRVSIIIGGKVSTGEDAQNSAESFIDNVSLEYRLDKGSTRYVKVFYDRSANDPLEGQLTKTGAGLVLRRKSNRLGELFLFRTKKKNVEVKTK